MNRCECGCGQEVKEGKRFIRLHHKKVCPEGKRFCQGHQDFLAIGEFYSTTAHALYYYCRKCWIIRQQKYYAANSTIIKKQAKSRNKPYRDKLRDDALQAYGDACACCGECTKESLTIDHKNGDGAQHRRSLGIKGGGGTTFYLWLRDNNYPSGFRVLCYNRNSSRGAYGYCPHEQK